VAVSSLTNKTVISGNGITTVFSYNFQINNAVDVLAIYTNATGVSTTLTSAQYTITGLGSVSGGTLTYPLTGSPIASGTTLTIARILGLTQPTSISNQGAFYPQAVEAAIDRAVMEVQQISEQIGRTIVGPITDATAMTPLPSATARASKALLFDALGNPIAGSLVPNGVISSVMAPFCASSSLVSAYALLRAAGPVMSIAEGGTGATTAAGALTALGGQTKTGIYYAKDYNILPANNAATNTTNLNALISILNLNPGGIIEFDNDVYNLNNLNHITGSNIVLRGRGRGNGGTILQQNQTTGEFITFSSCQFSGVEEMFIRPASSVRRTGGNGVVFSGCFLCYLRNINFHYQYTCIHIYSSTETRLDHVMMRYCLGWYGIMMEGTALASSYKCVAFDVISDNPYPNGYGTVKAWGVTTAYNAGDTINASGNVYQCSTSGTSGVSAPSGIPGTGADDAFTSTITDGTAQWKFVCSNSLSWAHMESFAYNLILHSANLINGAYGVYMSDTLNTGGSFPQWLVADDLELDHNFYTCVRLVAGAGVYITNSLIMSAMSYNGMDVNSTFKGEIIINGNRIMGNAMHGIIVSAAGPTNVTISNNHIINNSTIGSAVYHGISMAPNATRFNINNNQCGSDSTGITNIQGWGILVNTGTSDHYAVTNNICFGNVTGGTSDGGTGVNKTVSGNIT
jgi:hypothetical protein